MMLRLLVVLFSLCALCSGQIAVRDHATGTPIATPLLLPDVAVHDWEDKVIDVVNTGTSVASVSSALVTGQGFSLCCKSAFVLEAGATQSLTLHFAPTSVGYMTGSLQLDSTAIFVYARSVAAPALLFQTPAGLVAAHSGSPLILAADPNTPTQLSAVLQNQTSAPVLVHALQVSGDWQLAQPVSTPLELLPGDQINIGFTRSASANGDTSSGVVQVDQWSYAFTVHPKEPGIQFVLPPGPLQSGQQVSLSINFDSPPTSATSGTITLTFEPSGSSALSDPAILFPSTGTTTASFSSVAGQTSASFGGQNTLTFQTGTTAGVFHFHAAWDYSEADGEIGISPEPIGIESLSATRSSNAIDLTITGFDNTRTAGRFSFSFFDSKGAFIGDPIPADYTAAFAAYFLQTATDAGGGFKMTAHFPVSGNTSGISGVQVDLLNTSGDAQSSVTSIH